MGSGDLTRTRKRTGGVTPIVETLKKVFEEKQKRDYYSNLLDAYNKAQENMTGTNDVTEGTFTPPPNALALPNDINNVGQLQASEDVNSSVNAPMAEYSLGDFIPKKIEGTGPDGKTISALNPARYERGKKEAEDFQTLAMQEMLNPNTDPQTLAKLNVLSNFMNSQVEGIKPTAQKITAWDPNKTYTQNDAFGNERVVREAAKKAVKADRYGKDEYTATKDYPEFGIKKGEGVLGNYENGEFVALGKPGPKDKKGTGDGSGTDGGGKGLKETTAKLISNLKNLDPYKHDTEGNIITDKNGPVLKSELDLKYEKDNTLESIKLQLLSPSAYKFINNIERSWREGDKTGGTQYLPPATLKSEIEKHYKSGNLTDENLKEFKKYLSYYSEDIYGGLIK